MKISKLKKYLIILIPFFIFISIFPYNPSLFLGTNYIWHRNELIKAADAWIIPYWQRSIIEKIRWEIYKNSH